MGKQTGWALAGVSSLIVLAAAPLSAQEEAESSDIARAETAAAEAFDAYTQGDYPRAIALYRQALVSAPSADIIYNIARIYDTKQRDRAQAIEFYELYRTDPGAEAERVRTANERLAVLRELEAAQAKPAPRTAAAAGGASSGTTVSGPASIPERRSDGLSGIQLAGIFIGAAGVAGLGVGTGFGLAAQADADVTHDLCDGNACTSQRGVDAAEDAKRAATVSTVAFIAGSVLVAGGVTMLVLGGDSSTEKQRAILQLTPYASVESVGTQLTGRW
jgi:hypothetical protein